MTYVPVSGVELQFLEEAGIVHQVQAVEHVITQLFMNRH